MKRNDTTAEVLDLLLIPSILEFVYFENPMMENSIAS
jgi:hypothetical protein